MIGSSYSKRRITIRHLVLIICCFIFLTVGCSDITKQLDIVDTIQLEGLVLGKKISNEHKMLLYGENMQILETELGY